MSGNSRVGGLVGVSSLNSFIIESYATGDVTGSDHVGGLAGLLDYSGVAASFATGNATGTNDVGGLVGWRPDGHVRATYATGSVAFTGGASAHAGRILGGLIGDLHHVYTKGWLRANYATGRVSAPDGVAAGGLMGKCRSTDYTGIYADWNVDVDVGDNYRNYRRADDGPGDDPWDFGTSSQYPVLKYCAAKPGIDTQNP